MAAPTKPPLRRSFARDRWLWLPAVADVTVPTITEIQAAAGVNLSCATFGEQEGFSANTEKVQLPRRNCETDRFEVTGETTHSAPDFMLAFDPQGVDANGKDAWDAMDDLAEGFLVRGQDLDPLADFAVGEFVDVVPSQLGVKVPGKTGTGSDGAYAFTVSASIVATPAYNVAIVA